MTREGAGGLLSVGERDQRAQLCHGQVAVALLVTSAQASAAWTATIR